MTFRVIINQLQESCYQIEGQIRELSYEEGNLGDIISALLPLSGLGDIIPQLQKELRNIQEQELILRQMLQALNKTLSHYLNCENRIINELEQNTYSFSPRDVGVFEIPKVSDLIR